MDILSKKFLPLAVTLLWHSAAGAALPEKLTPGNMVILEDQDIIEIDRLSGDSVQTIALPNHVTGIRDIVVNQESNLVVLSDGPVPSVHVFDFSLPEGEREWQTLTADDWQFTDSDGTGELAVLGPVAYVADVATADGTTGILGFDLERGDVGWVTTGPAYQAVVVSPDLMLYGLRDDQPLVDVYISGRPAADPATTRFSQYQVHEVNQPRALAVDYADTLHVAGAGGEVARYIRHGEYLRSHTPVADITLRDFTLDETNRPAMVTEEGDMALPQAEQPDVAMRKGMASSVSFVPTYSLAAPVATYLALIDRIEGLPAGPESTRLLAADADSLTVTLVDERTLSIRFTGVENHELDFTIPEHYPLDWSGTHNVTDADNSGGDIKVSGEDCDLQGKFKVQQLELDDSGQPSQLKLNFNYQCDGASGSRGGIVAWQTSRHTPSLGYLPFILGSWPEPVLAGEPVRLGTPSIFPDDTIVDYEVTQVAGTPAPLSVGLGQSFSDSRYWPYVKLEFVAPLVADDSDLLTFQVRLETEQGKHYNGTISQEVRSRTAPRTRLHWWGLGLDAGLAFIDVGANGLMYVRPLGNSIEVTASGSDIGQLMFAAPEGMQLSPGTYTGATPWTADDHSGPTFWFADSRRGCSQPATSDFTVLRADYTEEQVNELAIDFDVHCDGGTITGELRYQDAGFTLTDADAGPDQNVAPGDEVVMDASGSSAPLGEITGYYWRQVSGPSVELTGEETATASFIAPEADDEPITLVFQVDAEGDESLENVDRVTVQVAVDTGEEADDEEDGNQSWRERLRRLWASLGWGR